MFQLCTDIQPYSEKMQHDVVTAIRTGDVATLEQLLAADPALVTTRLDGSRTLLHVATDWPGHLPNVRNTIATLVGHGADVNARFIGANHSETPLHWAASNDDLDALDSLLAHGADLEADGGVIGGGTPLADAVAFGQWQAARRLLEHGATCNLWQSAALGCTARMEELLAGDPPREELTNAFWCACHGGQLITAKRLLESGANLNWIGYDALTPLGAAMRNGNQELIDWLQAQGATTAA